MSLSLHDGVYGTVQTPTPSIGGGNPLLPSCIVGTASSGPLNTPIPFSDPASFKAVFGEITQAKNDLGTCAMTAMLACQAMGGYPNFYGIRVSDTTDTSPFITISDTAGAGTTIQFVASSSGSRASAGGPAGYGTAGFTLQNPAVASTFPVYNLTLTMPYAPPEVFNGLVAYKTNNGNPVSGFDIGTFLTNVKNAVNNGLSQGRPKSAYWVAVSPAQQSQLAPNPYPAGATGGSDGSANVTSAMLLGVGGVSGRTGLNAELGTGCGQYAISGLTDFTAASGFAAYGLPYYKLFVGPAFPSGTSTTTAVSTKNTNSYFALNSAVIKNWVYWFDYTQNRVRLVSPEGVALGIIAARSPEQSPGNQPGNGMNTFLAGTELGGVPIADAEKDALAAAGIIAIGPLERNPSLIGLVGGQNASTIVGQDGVNYVRLTGYLFRSFRTLLGQYVDALQSFNPNDSTRRLVKKTTDAFLQALLANNQISGFNTICDLTNNTPTSIAAGQLNIAITVQYLGTVRYLNYILTAGVGVQLTAQTNSVTTAT